MKQNPPNGPRAVRVLQVVEIETCRGEGVKGNPFRPLKTYWTLDGEFLAEYDVQDYMPTDSASEVQK